MKKQESILVLAIVTAFVFTVVFLPGLLRAGELEPTGPPGPTMHTLDEIYNKMDAFASGGCGVPAPVEKTGQTSSYDTGDDGDLEMGVAWPNPRFTDNGSLYYTFTVTDNLTGLMWLKHANCIAALYPGFDNDEAIGALEDGGVTWQHAIDFIAAINDGTYPDCGAGYTDWRVPNMRELASLIHYGVWDPTLPNTAGTGQWTEDDPFLNVPQESYEYFYWSSTHDLIGDPSGGKVWTVGFEDGSAESRDKTDELCVWAVRGGE